ncbi:MAG: FecR domain-containing protein, partial [Tannerellaceae bacterium]
KVPMGSQSMVILPDHSKVWVNAGSSLTYSNDFNGKTREVSLEGEAFFDVAKDSLRPFIVKSEKLDVKVLGTRFNVKAYREEALVEIGLVSGKVNVHLNDHPIGSGEVNLRPDRMLSFNKETKNVKVTEFNGADAFAWTEGRLKFTEQPFERIAKDLERKYNVTIRIESNLLKRQVYTGSFSASYSLSEILQEVNVDRRFVWKQKGTTFIIKDKR